MPLTTGRATDFITFTRASGATVVDANGAIKWAGHNLVLNSGSPATQTLTVEVGRVYTVECTGSGSVTLSGAGTGTVSAGTPRTVTASTTSLVLTVSGSVTTMWAYRSGLGGMVLNPATGTTYYPTTGSIYNAPRLDYDPATLAPRGLLVEEQRTNLLLNSATLSTQSVTVSAVAYTLSFWGTGTVTLSGTSTAGPLVGTGANNRVNLTFTPTAGTLTLTVTGTVTQAQLEAGSFATSYIPTLAASATRSADTASVATSAFPYNSAAGTLVANFDYSGAGSDIGPNIRNAVSLATVAGTERIVIYNRSGQKSSGGVFLSNTLTASPGIAGTQAADTTMKSAFAFAANDFAFTQDGAAVSTVTSGAMPAAADALNIGCNIPSSSVRLNGHIRQITYIPRRLTNAELQTRST